MSFTSVPTLADIDPSRRKRKADDAGTPHDRRKQKKSKSIDELPTPTAASAAMASGAPVGPRYVYLCLWRIRLNNGLFSATAFAVRHQHQHRRSHASTKHVQRSCRRLPMPHSLRSKTTRALVAQARLQGLRASRSSRRGLRLRAQTSKQTERSVRAALGSPRSTAEAPMATIVMMMRPQIAPTSRRPRAPRPILPRRCQRLLPGKPRLHRVPGSLPDVSWRDVLALRRRRGGRGRARGRRKRSRGTRRPSMRG